MVSYENGDEELRAVEQDDSAPESAPSVDALGVELVLSRGQRVRIGLSSGAAAHLTGQCIGRAREGTGHRGSWGLSDRLCAARVGHRLVRGWSTIIARSRCSWALGARARSRTGAVLGARLIWCLHTSWRFVRYPRHSKQSERLAKNVYSKVKE